MSDGRYSMEWLESKLDLFDSEKSGLAVELHNSKRRTGLLSYILCGCALLALVFAALMAIAPNALTGAVYRSGANVETVLTILGVLAVAVCSAAVLFSDGTLRLGAIAVSALTLICGAVALLTMQSRLAPIAVSDAEGLESINRFRTGSFELTEDIDLGEGGVSLTSFAGRLNGGGHAVTGGRGFTIGNNYGSVRDLLISGVSVSGGRCALLCDNNYCSVSGVRVEESSLDAGSGALVLNNKGGISGCSVAAEYACTEKCAGIALESSGSIERCEFSGVVSGTAAFGGIVNKLTGGSVVNCISRGRADSLREGSCGIAFAQSGGRIEKCFTDMSFADGLMSFYPICSSVVNGGGGTVTQCYAVSNDAYAVCGDCVLIPRSELCEARLPGLDFSSVWYFDESGVLRLAVLASGPIPQRTEEAKPTATPTPTATPKPTPTPTPVTPQPTLSPEEMFGELDYYPEESELLDEPAYGSVKQGHNANVRPGPGGEFRSFMRLGGGEQVKIFAKSGEWFLIGYNEVFGWVHEDMIKIDQD